MNTRGSKTHDGKSSDDLGRHQRVLDAYLAHTGSDPLPPPGLDAKLLALATNSVKEMTRAPHRAENDVASTHSDGITFIKTAARPRRRQWPFALAASVATLGFAAILARTTFQSRPDEGAPDYSTGRYEAKSVAQAQAPVAPAPAAAKLPAPPQQAAPQLEESASTNRDQSASVAAMSPADDKAKLNVSADPEFERAAERALGRVPSAPESAVPMPLDSGSTSASAAAQPAAKLAPSKSDTGTAESAFAPPAPAATGSASTQAAADATVDAASIPAAAPPVEIAELDAPAADTRSRRSNAQVAPIMTIPTQNGAAETAAAPMSPAKTIERGAILAEAKPAPSAAPQVQAAQAQPDLGLMQNEMPQGGASAPQADAANSKKDEFAPDPQAAPANQHAKTYAAIRALRDGGELVKAKAMLARFRKAYPQVTLPEDLKVLTKAK